MPLASAFYCIYFNKKLLLTEMCPSYVSGRVVRPFEIHICSHFTNLFFFFAHRCRVELVPWFVFLSHITRETSLKMFLSPPCTNAPQAMQVFGK